MPTAFEVFRVPFRFHVKVALRPNWPPDRHLESLRGKVILLAPDGDLVRDQSPSSAESGDVWISTLVELGGAVAHSGRPSPHIPLRALEATGSLTVGAVGPDQAVSLAIARLVDSGDRRMIAASIAGREVKTFGDMVIDRATGIIAKVTLPDQVRDAVDHHGVHRVWSRSSVEPTLKFSIRKSSTRTAAALMLRAAASTTAPRPASGPASDPAPTPSDSVLGR